MKWVLIENVADEVKAAEDVIVCDALTGRIAVSNYVDQPWRRGWRHRNGFPATHYLADAPPLPKTEPCHHCEGNGGTYSEDGGSWVNCAPCKTRGWLEQEAISALQNADVQEEAQDQAAQDTTDPDKEEAEGRQQD